jgi:hypothetical protein
MVKKDEQILRRNWHNPVEIDVGNRTVPDEGVLNRGRTISILYTL